MLLYEYSIAKDYGKILKPEGNGTYIDETIKLYITLQILQHYQLRLNTRVGFEISTKSSKH